MSANIKSRTFIITYTESRPEGSNRSRDFNYISSLKDDFAIFLYDVIESELI